MTGRKNGRELECVVIDLNTQYDYCSSDGAFPVRNVDQLVFALRRMIAWSKRNRAAVVASVESRRPCDLADQIHSSFCEDGTFGQRKIDFTVLEPSINVEVDNTLSCPLDLFREYQQIIFRKRGHDLLENPKADRLLTQLPVREYIVYGVAMESSVKVLVLGLLAREKNVTVVSDACGYWNRGSSEQALRQMAAKGAQTITVDELSRRKLDRRWRRWPVAEAAHTRTNGKRSNGRLPKPDNPADRNGRSVRPNGPSTR